MTYMIALAWNGISSLVALNPQPSSPGILYAYEASSLGLSVPQGKAFTWWQFNEVLTQDNLNSILSQVGLSDSVQSRKVTVMTRDNNGYFITRNAYIAYPKNGEEMRREVAFWRRVRFPITGLRVG